MKKLLFTSFALLLGGFLAKAQVSPCNCSANVSSGNRNFSALSWTGTGCPTAGSTSYSGNLCVNLANGANLIMDKNFTISGGFGISNGGSSTFTLPAGRTLNVGGNMGDDNNNNVTFVINGDLTVGGTIYGKNSNAFSGSGSVTASGLDFFHEPTCSPCNIDWNVSTCSPSNTTFCNIVMPVTLIYFEANINTDHIALEWATATELNFDRFIIEKTMDGKTFFEIGSLPGAGFSSIRRDYEFKDTAPIIGRSYYRLKAVDIDGYTEYFGLVVAEYNGKKSITLYPNPTQGNSITVLTNFKPEEGDKAEIFDNLGIKLLEISMTDFEQNIDFRNRLGQGSYLLRYTSTNHTQVIRFTAR